MLVTSRSRGSIFFPPGVIVNTVVPASTLPDAAVTPGRTAIWPPVGNDWRPASSSVTESLADEYVDGEVVDRMQHAIDGLLDLLDRDGVQLVIAGIRHGRRSERRVEVQRESGQDRLADWFAVLVELASEDGLLADDHDGSRVGVGVGVGVGVRGKTLIGTEDVTALKSVSSVGVKLTVRVWPLPGGKHGSGRGRIGQQARQRCPVERGDGIELGGAQGSPGCDIGGIGPVDRRRRLADDQGPRHGRRSVIRVIEGGRHRVVARLGRVGHRHAVLGIRDRDARQPAGAGGDNGDLGRAVVGDAQVAEVERRRGLADRQR